LTLVKQLDLTKSFNVALQLNNLVSLLLDLLLEFPYCLILILKRFLRDERFLIWVTIFVMAIITLEVVVLLLNLNMGIFREVESLLKKDDLVLHISY